MWRKDGWEGEEDEDEDILDVTSMTNCMKKLLAYFKSFFFSLNFLYFYLFII